MVDSGSVGTYDTGHGPFYKRGNLEKMQLPAFQSAGGQHLSNPIVVAREWWKSRFWSISVEVDTVPAHG